MASSSASEAPSRASPPGQAAGDASAVKLGVGVNVALDEGVPVELDEPVPVWLDEPVFVELDEGVSVWLDDGVPVPVSVWLLLGVPVWLAVCEADAVTVWEAVCEGEAVPVLEAVCDDVAVTEPVCDDDAVPVPVVLGVCDGEGVSEGVTVGVMDVGARHTRTESTSSSDGAKPSSALRTRNCSVCVPGVAMTCSWCIHSVVTYEPYSRSDALKSVLIESLGDASVIMTTPPSSPEIR